MQPVLVQSLNDEFNLAELNSKTEMPATAGTHLMDSGPKWCGAMQMRYHSGVGKLLYLVSGHDQKSQTVFGSSHAL